MTNFDVLGTMRAVRNDSTLSNSEKSLLWAAALRTDSRTMRVRASMELLAADTQLSYRSVRRAFEGDGPGNGRYFAKVSRSRRRLDLWFHPSPESAIVSPSQSPAEWDRQSTSDEHGGHLSGTESPPVYSVSTERSTRVATSDEGATCSSDSDGWVEVPRQKGEYQYGRKKSAGRSSPQGGRTSDENH